MSNLPASPLTSSNTMPVLHLPPPTQTQTTHNLSIPSEERLTLKTSASSFLYDGNYIPNFSILLQKKLRYDIFFMLPMHGKYLPTYVSRPPL